MKVALKQARVWTCPDCGLESFTKCVPFEPELSDLDRGYFPGKWVTPPEIVECGFCGMEYEAEEPEDD